MSSVDTTSSKDKLFNEFKTKFSSFIPAPLLSFFTEEDLQHFLRARYNFFINSPKNIKIEVSNPGMEYFWLINSSIIEILTPDLPFAIETLLDYFESNNYRVNQIIHPLFGVSRNEKGRATGINYISNSSESCESHIYIEIARQSDKNLERIKKELTANFNELSTIVSDFPDVTDKISKLNFKSELFQAEQKWLRNNFIILGMMELKNKNHYSNFRGIFRNNHTRQLAEKELTERLNSFPNETIKYYESQAITGINKHKTRYYIILKSAETTILLLGHFSHRTGSMIRSDIPSICHQLNQVAKSQNTILNSFSGKELLKAAQLTPIEILLTRNPAIIKKLLLKITSNIYINEPEFEFFIDEDYNQLWVLGIIPTSDSDQLPGKNFEAVKNRFEIEIKYNIRREFNQNQLLLFSCQSSTTSIVELQKYLQQNSAQIFSSWQSELRKLISNRYVGEQEISRRTRRFLDGITEDFELHQTPDETLYDLDLLDNLQPEVGFKVHFYNRNAEEDIIKIYSIGPSNLSDFVPVLSGFRLFTKREQTYIYQPESEQRYIYSFTLPVQASLNEIDRRRISNSIAAVLNRETTLESTNALSTLAGLDVKELNLVKGIAGYFFQIDKSHSRFSIRDVLVKYPNFTRQLIDYFHSRHNPESKLNEKKIASSIEELYQSMDSSIHEGICRALFSVVEAIVRTNYYHNGRDMAFKVECSRIEQMPRPVPLFEIFVYSYDLEGTHLRGGYVARGGIRWSDRPDDFRTEILGLLTAQMIKNTLIVPVGSKGGFIIKNRRFASRQERLEVGIESYKRYIRALLTLTDNLAPHGKVIPAEGIKRLDQNDPYLVVAADKGTATFSDIANEISIDKKFWLKDAFASGGSNGYDHKKQGITARGAWESVRRHFHEMQINPNQDPITVAGIGDMGGDVFGNGMLISKSIKLIAAFNHLHIFIDPDPDPARSHRERERLFKCVGGWGDYNPSLISKGGGVYDRNNRKIKISPQAAVVLGIPSRTYSGEELIQAILQAPLDLLWNGGIGTYVKASHEIHFQAHDPMNDRVRVDASQLRVKVIGEGGNLGLTQAARLEANEHGICVNNDAIDNSAGVDMSDHEVNLKILLNTLQGKKLIRNLNERNLLIRKYEPFEIETVLQHNYENNLAISADYRRVPTQFQFFRALINFFDREGIINRKQDAIPFEADMDRIENSKRLLPRPLLCLLMGYTKLHIEQVLNHESKLFEDAWYLRFVERYFPPELTRRHNQHIRKHPLCKEIIITECVNKVVNNAGIVFYQRMLMRTVTTIPHITDAYIRINEAIGADKLRAVFKNKWYHAELHYEFLLLLEEKLFHIIKKVLSNEKIYKNLSRFDSAAFNQILESSISHSRFGLKKEFRRYLKTLDPEVASDIIKTFHSIDIIDDVFNLYINQNFNNKKWEIETYFDIVDNFRIRELREVILNFGTHSSWEILFLSKIEESMDELLSRVIDLSQKGRVANHERAFHLMNKMITLSNNRTLSPAACYEMTEYIKNLFEA